MTSARDQGIEVLNGRVFVGNRVAYAYRDGNTAEIRVGEVVDIVDTGRTEHKYDPDKGYYERPVIRVRVRTETASRGLGAGKVHGIEVSERIVRL